MSSSTLFDLSVFTNGDNANPEDFKTSTSLKRILSSLKYYSLLNVETKKEHQNIFDDFVNNIYSPQLLIMDYYYIRKSYEHQIYDIMNYARDHYKFEPSIDYNKCPYSLRLYRINSAQESNKNTLDNPKLSVVCDLFDSIYHYIFRLFDSGLRVKKNKDVNNGDNGDDKDEYFDAKLQSIVKQIASTRDIATIFHEKPVEDESIDDHRSDNILYDGSGFDTYLDTVYNHLRAMKISNEIIEKVMNYAEFEGYDSEAMGMDLTVDINDGGNISNLIQDEKCIDAMTQIFTKSHRM